MLKKILFISLIFFDVMAVAQTEKDTAHLVKIEPFYSIPEIIDGCTCFFSSSLDNCRNGEFLFVNDFTVYGCIKINGFIQLLELSSYNVENGEFTYIGQDIVVEIRIKDVIEENDGMYSIAEFKAKCKAGSYEGQLFGRCDC